MIQTYQGVVKNGVIISPELSKIKNGTQVLVIPQIDSEDQWLTATKAAKRFQISVKQIRQWMKSGKIRIHASDPELVNASDVEDAVDQYELSGLAMEVMERDELG